MKSITPAAPGTVRLMFTWNPLDPVDGMPECIWHMPVVSWVTEEEVVGPDRETRWSAMPVSPFDLATGWGAPIGGCLQKEAIVVDGVIYDTEICETFSSEKEWIEACIKWANDTWTKKGTP